MLKPHVFNTFSNLTSTLVSKTLKKGLFVRATLACCEEDTGKCHRSIQGEGVHEQGCFLHYVPNGTYNITGIQGRIVTIKHAYTGKVYTYIPLTHLRGAPYAVDGEGKPVAF